MPIKTSWGALLPHKGFIIPLIIGSAFLNSGFEALPVSQKRLMPFEESRRFNSEIELYIA